MARTPLLAALLMTLVLPAALLAQGSTGGTGALGGSVTVSPFLPDAPPVTPTLLGGGQGYIPGDAGQGGVTSGGGGSVGGDAPDAGPVGGARRTGTPTATTRPPTRNAIASARATGNSPGVPLQPPDDWRMWWEMNKFDFIELRRIIDAPYDGQGIQTETDAERARRLEQVQIVVSERVAPVLRELTTASDPAVRASAIVTLGKLRDEQAPTLAKGMLRDKSFAVRRSAMLALGLLESGRASFLLVHIAADSKIGRELLDTTRVSDDDRTIALLTTALRGEGSAEGLVERLLDERDDLTNPMLAGVCETAGLMRSQRSLRTLVTIARDKDLPEFVRSSATNALGRLGDPSVIPTLMQLLDDRIEPRRAATIALGRVSHQDLSAVVGRLATILTEDDDASSRHFAAISLGRIGGPAAQRALNDAFVQASGDMRPWIALGLGMCERRDRHGDLVPRLIERMGNESNRDVREAYLIAMGLCGDNQGLEALSEQLANNHADLAGKAAMALGLTGHPDAQPILRSALANNSSPIVQRQVALALGILGDASTIPDLLDLIKTTSNPYVASFAANGVAFMGDENAIGPLLSIIERNGSDGGIQTIYAVAAVGQLFDSDRRPALSRLAAGDNYLARTTAVKDLIALGF